MSGAGEYWLEQWMSEYEISSSRDYSSAVRSPTAIKSLHERARNQAWDEENKLDIGRNSVLAARSLDLSSFFTDHCFNCLKAQLNTLVSRTAHYFEQVVVSGPIAQSVQYRLESKQRSAEVLAELRGHVDLLLYIQKIGLRDRIIFVRKPENYCAKCLQNEAHEAGFRFLGDEAQSQAIIKTLTEKSKFHFMRNRSGNWKVTVRSPMLPQGSWIHTYGRTRPTRARAAADLFHNLNRPAVVDASAAKHYHLPLVDTYEVSWLSNDRTDDDGPSADEVALHVELPTLVGLELEDFVRLQDDERDSYVRFQAAVRSAVRESLTRHGPGSPREIAQAVVDEFISPELADIERKLKSATRSLSKKVATSVAVGATVTSIGLLTAMPLVIATGVGAAATSLPQLYKYFDDHAGIESADMYFLWKLNRIRHV